jgi:CRISPR-associated protein Cas2
MFVVVAYDIVDDDRRTRLASHLLGYGRRVQKSVFECVINDKQYLEMKAGAEAIIDMVTDSVRYYLLCRRCLQAVEISGMGTVTEDDSDSVHIF